MATTFGYSCKNSRTNGSGTRCLIASRGVRVTTGCQACAWSIHWVCTAGHENVTGGNPATLYDITGGAAAVLVPGHCIYKVPALDAETGPIPPSRSACAFRRTR